MYASEENMFSAISVQAHLSLALNREKLALRLRLKMRCSSTGCKLHLLPLTDIGSCVNFTWKISLSMPFKSYITKLEL